MKILTGVLSLLVTTHVTTYVTTCVTTAALAAGGAAGAAEVDGPAVTVLSRAQVGGHAVVTTGDGTVVAAWERATNGQTRILAAVRPVGGDWQPPDLLASWSPADVRGVRGEPRLVAGPAGSVVAVWVSARLRVVRAAWRPGSGWGTPRRLSGAHEVAVGPRAASNDLGQVAVTWQRRTSDHRVLVRSAVQLGSGWTLSTVGTQGPRGLGAEPALVGIDGAGNVSAAWYRLRPKPPNSGDGLEKAQNRSLASRLATGSTTWEAPHAFVGAWEPYVPGDHTSLVVEDDGTAWVGDWAGAWNAPQPGPMWTREGSGAWVADDRAPYADEFVTSGDELVSWGDSDAHALDAVHTRQPDGTWTSADFRATSVVLNASGDAAAVGIRQDTLLTWIRDASGAWGPEQVLVQNVSRQNDRGDEPVATASIAPDGTVTVLWGTYADEFPGDHPERGPDLRSVQFSAVAPAP